jgi:hypothetical protein
VNLIVVEFEASMGFPRESRPSKIINEDSLPPEPFTERLLDETFTTIIEEITPVRM